MEEKRFDEWNKLAKKLHKNTKPVPFREREVWWYAAGENIGSEINGKNDSFSRPILIIRKYGGAGFFGAPLSTQIHRGRWYETINMNGEKSCVLLSQSSSFSAARLYGPICRISCEDYEKVLVALNELLFKGKIFSPSIATGGES